VVSSIFDEGAKNLARPELVVHRDQTLSNGALISIERANILSFSGTDCAFTIPPITIKAIRDVVTILFIGVSLV